MLGHLRLGEYVQPRLWICAVSLLIAAPALARAQAVTGSLEGRVLSTQDEPLELVTVTASGPFLQGPRAVTSDASGHFRIQALPPGEYELRLALIGYQPLTIQGAVVELGRTTGLEPVAMSAQPVALEPIAVTAQAISIDPEHTTVGGTLVAADYASLPVDRDYKSLITVLPHANESAKGDPTNVGGSTGLENQYYIDGVNVTDPVLGARATSLPYNFVRAVEVKTGGYEAQYGRALGAVVNAITYTGTNDFEVNLFGFVQPSALAMSPRLAPVITEGRSISYDFGARVSGPIVRDRLWYSAALNPRVDRVEKEMAPFGLFPEQYNALRFAGKLTWQASSATGLELSVFGDPTTWHAIDAPVMGTTTILNPDAYRSRRQIGGVVAALRATLTPSPAVMLEASVAGQWDRNDVEGETALGRSEGLYIDRVTLSAGGGYYMHRRERQDHRTVTARGTFTLARHTLVAGAEYLDAVIATTGGANGVGQVTRTDTSSYEALYVYSDSRVQDRSPAAYLQDSWRVTDRFTLNAGLRWSGQFITNGSGRVVQEFTGQWQPRTGFSWQLGSLGSQRLFGSYGRVYEVLPGYLAANVFLNATYLNSYYSSDPRLPGAVRDSVADWSSIEPNGLVNSAGAEADNFDEYTLGYERRLGAGTRLTVRGLYRHLRAAYLNGCDSTWRCANGTPGQGNFDFLPAAKREYTALEIGLVGAWRGLSYRASYVLSRTWGNYTGFFSSDKDDEEGFTPGINATFSYPEQVPNSTGLLPNDRTHVVKASAAYGFGSGFGAGVFLSAGSGAPLNEFAAGTIGSYWNPVFLVPRGTAGRTPFLWTVDLRFAYTLPGGPRTRVLLDVLHLGNPRSATRVDEYHYLTLDRNAPSATYMQPVIYQPPMGARLGVEMSF